MISYPELKVEDFSALMQADADIAAVVAARGCPYCGGPLHVANYKRKPRGGVFAGGGESFSLRHSLCCGRRGCRRRVLPPSVRFFGRRVYLEAAMLFAIVWLQVAEAFRAAERYTRVSARTLARWWRWWREEVPRSAWWAELRSRLTPPAPDEAALPAALLSRLRQIASGVPLVWLAAKCLAPATTPLADAAGFLREAGLATSVI
jgi:hypothetical protein